MKPLQIITCTLVLGIVSAANAQEPSNMMFDNKAKADTNTMAKADSDAEPDMTGTPFVTTLPSSPQGCSFVTNVWRDRKIYTKKNGYKIVTTDKEEVVEVKRKSEGGRKITYSNDYETLKYHLKSDGTLHYKYLYWNDCQKVKLRRNSSGITSMTNKTGMEQKEVRNNVRGAIAKGVNSCSNINFE